MSSRRVEVLHRKAVDQILSASGMVCVRSPPHSVQPSTLTTESEERASTEEYEESSFALSSEAESATEVTEAFTEEEKTIFPSPSLRRVVTDKLRKIEAHNRIHVLPEEFKTNIDPELIPRISPQVRYLETIAQLVGCTEYRNSMAEYWFLDTMANLLSRAQEDQLPKESQAVLMLWFCEWMKEIQHFDAADRNRHLRRFKDNMLAAARFIAKEQRLPTPADAGVYYKAVDEEAPEQKKGVPVPDVFRLVPFSDCAYQCAMKDLVKIMHYIFDLFSTDYQFDLVQSVFTFTPEYNLIEMPYTLQNPKRLFAALKPKKEKPKKEPKKEKDKKGKKKDFDTEEYLALMELKAREERELEELEAKEAESWNLRNSILPLGLTATDELFDKYWPPPPEPEPEPEPEVKQKPDKKKKK